MGEFPLEFKTQKGDLSRTLDLVLNIVPPKTTLPVLSNLLLDVKTDSICVVSTDLDTTVTTTLKGEVIREGMITLPARRLNEIIHHAGDDEIHFSLEDETVVRIVCGSTDCRLPGILEEEFPKIPSIQTKERLQLPAGMLRRMVAKTAFAVSKDETRPALNGIFWRIEPRRMEMVCTDGYRLARMERTGEFPVKGKKEFLVSPKALNQMAHLAEDSDEMVDIRVDNNYLVFSCAGTVVYSRLLEGPFPRYEQVIPKDNRKELITRRDRLMQSCRRVAIFSDSLTHQVQLSVKKNELVLKSNTPDVGEATDRVEAEYSEDEMDIGYNATYLADILKHIDGDMAKFRLDSPIKAGIIEPVEQEKDENYFCLLMPLRLAE